MPHSVEIEMRCRSFNYDAIATYTQSNLHKKGVRVSRILYSMLYALNMHCVGFNGCWCSYTKYISFHMHVSLRVTTILLQYYTYTQIQTIIKSEAVYDLFETLQQPKYLSKYFNNLQNVSLL